MITVVCNDTVDVETFNIQAQNRSSNITYTPSQYTHHSHTLSGGKTRCKVLHPSGAFYKLCDTVRCETCELDVVIEDSIRYEPVAPSVKHMKSCTTWKYDPKFGPPPVNIPEFHASFFFQPPGFPPRHDIWDGDWNRAALFSLGNCLLLEIMQMIKSVPTMKGFPTQFKRTWIECGRFYDAGFDAIMAKSLFWSKQEVLRALKNIHRDWRSCVSFNVELKGMGGVQPNAVELNPPPVFSNDQSKFFYQSGRQDVLSQLLRDDCAKKRDEVKTVLSDSFLDRAGKMSKILSILSEGTASSSGH